MTHRLEKPYNNMKCQAKSCKSNRHGYCYGVPSVTVEEKEIVPQLDVFNRGIRVAEVQEIWGCGGYERKKQWIR